MAKYYKLGVKALSFFDPKTGLSLSPNTPGMVTAKTSKRINDAKQGGHIVPISEKEYNDMMAALPKDAAVNTSESPKVKQVIKEVIKEIPVEVYTPAILTDADFKSMSIEDLKSYAVRLPDLSFDSIKEIMGFTKKVDVADFISDYFDED